MMSWIRVLVSVVVLSACTTVRAFTPSPEALSHQRTQRTRVAAETETSRSSQLPELKGDFDWDEAYKEDDDWLTGQDVPGKMVLNEVELAKQVTALTKLEEKWRAERLDRDYEESRKVGWVESAETLNGRTAMFFIVTGLLTELWTGETMPQQIEGLLRIAGVIGFDG